MADATFVSIANGKNGAWKLPDANTVWKFLKIPAATGWISYHDMFTSADYAVDTGKKFLPLYYTITGTPAATEFRESWGQPTVNSSTAAYIAAYHQNRVGEWHVPFPPVTEVTAGHYVTSGATATTTFFLNGVEFDV